VLLAALGVAAAAQAADFGGTANVVVVQPLFLVKSQALDFGGIAVGTTAGTVVINPNTGARTVTGGVTALTSSFAPAAFIGAGASKSKIAIIKEPRSAITLTRSGGTETMLVDTFMVEGGNGTSRQLEADGTIRFKVGATLRVGANQARGTYVGTFNMTIDYN